MKKVVLADDHPIFRAGLRQILEEDARFEIVAETGNGDSCITILEMLKPEIVILDLAMPGIDGYGVLKWIRTHAPGMVGVILSMHSSRNFATKAKELGARAFVAKEDAGQELQNALMTPVGVFYMSASVGGQRAPVVKVDDEAIESKDLIKQLTPREHSIFNLVGDNLTSRQIGLELGVSHRTVQTHRQKIVSKLGLSGPNQLLEFAIRHASQVE